MPQCDILTMGNSESWGHVMSFSYQNFSFVKFPQTRRQRSGAGACRMPAPGDGRAQSHITSAFCDLGGATTVSVFGKEEEKGEER